jgi:hypothetical protein
MHTTCRSRRGLSRYIYTYICMHACMHASSATDTTCIDVHHACNICNTCRYVPGARQLKGSRRSVPGFTHHRACQARPHHVHAAPPKRLRKINGQASGARMIQAWTTARRRGVRSAGHVRVATRKVLCALWICMLTMRVCIYALPCVRTHDCVFGCS